MPAIFIAGFIPMFLTAYAYRELNSDNPDCGASFTWSTKAFGPYVGWMCGWGMVLATIIVLSNLAAIAVEFCYLTFANLFDNPSIADISDNKFWNIVTTLAFIAIATWISSRGITTSERVQYVLVGFQMVMLVIFAVVAIAIYTDSRPDVVQLGLVQPVHRADDGRVRHRPHRFDLRVLGLGHLPHARRGVQGPHTHAGPRRPAVRGVDPVDLPAGVRRDDDVRRASAPKDSDSATRTTPTTSSAPSPTPVLGSFGGLMLYLAVFVSSIASLQTTFLPAARTMLAMGAYGAFPKHSPRSIRGSWCRRSPPTSSGVITAVFYAVVSLLSESVLLDTIAALGIMICWYYGITAFACVWYFRTTCSPTPTTSCSASSSRSSAASSLATVFVISVEESMDPENGSGASIGGIGLVFFLGFGLLLLGVVLMFVMRAYRPAFFRGETLTRHTGALIGEVDMLRTEDK